jgi:nitroreductase
MPCEVPEVRAQLKAALGLPPAAEPLLLVRLGYAAPMPRSPRRPLASVLLDERRPSAHER